MATLPSETTQSGTTLRDTILPGAIVSRHFADRMLAGLTEANFYRKALGKDGLIEGNHPGFCFGHLSIYPYRYINSLGLAELKELSPEYISLFTSGAVCHDDKDANIYPPMHIVLDTFKKGYDVLTKRVSIATDDELAVINPNEKTRDRFPTLASTVSFTLSGHMSLHIGQVSAWRRAHGLGAA